jgi:hypothetical protein
MFTVDSKADDSCFVAFRLEGGMQKIYPFKKRNICKEHHCRY